MTIKEMREKTYLSQAKFAKLLDIPVANITKWEQGISSPPPYVIKLIEYYLRNSNLI
jgi:DNA-binding transcriptional regulator YiaG